MAVRGVRVVSVPVSDQDRATVGETNMPEITRRLAEALDAHRSDRVLDDPNAG